LFKLCGTNGYTYNVQVYARKSQVDGTGLGWAVCKNIRWYHNVATEILFRTAMVNALIVYNTIEGVSG